MGTLVHEKYAKEWWSDLHPLQSHKDAREQTKEFLTCKCQLGHLRINETLPQGFLSQQKKEDCY